MEAEPREALVLRVRQTGMIDEAGEIALSQLEDLVRWAAVDGGLHAVKVVERRGDDAYEFAYCRAAGKILCELAT